MAVSGVAMSSAVFLAGGGTIALDRFIDRSGWAARNPWSAWYSAARCHQEKQGRSGCCWRP